MHQSAAIGALAGGAALCGAAVLGYAVRGRSSQVFGPSVYRGNPKRHAVALTFDDGPSEGTPELLEILNRYGTPATFFQCGANVRRLPEVARAVAASGHEVGNHSDTHPALYFRSAGAIQTEFARAQQTIEDTLGVSARWMRAPFGARWFGFDAMQRRLGLVGVMWTVIGRDWALDAEQISARILRLVKTGAIICLHDGRELTERPDIRPTLDAVRRLLPALAERGYQFQTVSQILCPTN
jgi:peptidoglycan-N-acetylglucosamine deacetylase